MNTSVRDCVRCSAITAKVTRCTRSTCIYPGMCFQHFQARNGLKLAASNIPNAGLGLFTTRAIQPYRKISDYTGNIVPDDEWVQNQSAYGVQFDKDHTLDGRSTQTGIARYANECRKKDRLAGRCRGNNSQLRHTKQNTIILESKSRRIPANTKVLTSYGAAYWEK